MKSFSTYSAVMWYGILILGLVVAVFFEYGFFSGRLNTLDTESKEVQSQITVLESRKNALAALTPDVLSKSSKVAEVIPSENSILAVSQQIRNSAQNNIISVKNLNVVSVADPAAPELKVAQLGFIAEGSSDAVLGFLAEIPFLAPLMQLEGVNVTQTELSTLAQVNLRSFWAALPTKLPALTEAVTALTPEEEALLSRIEQFRSATPAAVIAPTEQGGVNEEPFTSLQ